MATVREYFDSDIKLLALAKDWIFSIDSKEKIPSPRAKISWDFDANAKFWSFFIPNGVNVQNYVNILLNFELTKLCILSADGDSLEVTNGFQDYSEIASSKTLMFTKRIFLYIDADLSIEERKIIAEAGLERGFYVLIRDREYARKKSEAEKPLAFICHDSRDKEELVQKLAIEMSKLMCPIWYDEYSLKVGDSLRETIEKGLKETQYCIVVLSPNFLSNSGWSKSEFDSIYTREIIEKRNVILPIWHNVSTQEVYNYSPKLADKFALNSNIGVEKLASQLVTKVKSDQSLKLED